MGTFYVDFTLWNRERTQSCTLTGLVDSGVSYTLVPASALDELGIEPAARERFSLADGSLQELPVGRADVELDGRIRTVYVVFGAGEKARLGAMTLDAFSLAVDARNRRLVRAEPPL